MKLFSGLINIGLAIILLMLVVAPLVGVVQTLLASSETIPLSRSSIELFSTTIILAGSVSLLSVVLGVFSGIAMLFLPPWIRYFLLYAALVTFFVPGYIYASAWIDLVSVLPGIDTIQLFSLPGAIIVLSLIHFPVLTCATYTACMRIEQEKLEIARMEGSVFALYRHVVLPNAVPFIATGALVVFLLNLSSYTIPSFFQVTTYPIEIFTLYNAFHNPASGLQLVLPLMGIALGAILLWWILIGYHLSQSSYHPPKPILLKTRTLPRVVILSAMGCLLLLSIGLPLIMVVAGEVSFAYLRIVWEQSQHEWFISLSLELSTTTAIVFISSIGTFITDSLPRPLAFGILILFCIPFLISGPAWGIGVIQFWNHSGWRGVVYDQPIIVLMAYAGKYLFVAWIGLTFALRSISREYADAACVFGVSRVRQYWSIILPLTLPYMLAMGTVVFLLVLGDVDSVVLVSPPGIDHHTGACLQPNALRFQCAGIQYGLTHGRSRRRGVGVVKPTGCMV